MRWVVVVVLVVVAAAAVAVCISTEMRQGVMSSTTLASDEAVGGADKVLSTPQSLVFL